MNTATSNSRLIPILLCTTVLVACGSERTPEASEASMADSSSSVSLTGGSAAAPADTTDHQRTIEPSEASMIVYKSPTCGCCADWVGYMNAAGFATTSVDTDDLTAIKVEHGLSSPSLYSCHTAIIDGYVIEGHVPAADVRRLLEERPAGIVGLTAPGMPMLSPGMGSLEPKDYDVLAFDKQGETRVWSSY